MQHTPTLTPPLNTSTLKLIKGWHLLLVAVFVLLACVGFAAFLYGHSAAAGPTLGTAQSFAVLGGSTVTNTGPTTVNGDLGVSPGLAVVGFPPGTVIGGTIHAGDAVAMQAQSDVTTAYNVLAGLPCNTNLTGQDLGGLTLAPGNYCFNTSAQLTGILTLDAQGDPNAVFIFQIGSTLTTASNSRVQVINAGQACNVFWQVGSSATLGTGTAFEGNILALASITLNTGASLTGRALARTGAVTMDTNVVSAPTCFIVPPAPAPPLLSKAFNPATINAGSVSTLTITLTNPNTTVATLTAPLTDNLPAGVVIAPVPNAVTTCGGVVTAPAGGSMVTLTGGAIPGGAPGTCTVMVDVIAGTGGNFLNTLPANALQTSNGNNIAAAIATLTVVPPAPAPPTLGKAFNPATINAGGVSTLTITLSNPNAGAATLTAPLIDNLPAGVVIAPVPNAVTTCGGVVTAPAGGSMVTLTGGAIPGGAPGTCTVMVDVTAGIAGNYLNTLPAGALQTNNGNNAAPAIATLTVVPPPPTAPTLSKAFNPATINAGGVSTLTITLSNPNLAPANLTAPLIDNLPAGVVIAPVPNAVTTCGGVVTAPAGGSMVTLTGGAIPGGAPGTCTVMVDVTAPLGGSYLNTLPANALQTNNGNNAAPAIATLTVVPPGPAAPLLGKAFNPATINAGGVSTLTITLSNPNAGAATLTAPLIDNLPAGVVIAPVPNASTTCGGVVTAPAGGSMVTLTGGVIPGGAPGTCTVMVNVTAVLGGSFLNTLPAGALQTNNGNNAAPAIATLTVIPPPPAAPTLSKAFNPATINAGGVSTLTITLSNPNLAPANLTAPLIDNLPAGVVIAPVPNASTTCGGVVTAPAGGSMVTLTGGAIPGGAPGTCTVMVNVTAALGGSYLNTLPANALQTNNGNNAAPAIATLTVVPPGPAAPLLGKAFNPATINAGGVSTLTITLSNPNAGAATLTAPLIDNLPAGVVIAPVPNAVTTCGGVVTAPAGGSMVTLTGGVIPGGAPGTCTVMVNVTAPLAGNYLNTLPAGALQTNNGNNAAPAIATLAVVPVPLIPLTLGKAFNPATINAGGVSTLTITLTNPNTTVATLTAPLTDNLPAGVVIAPVPNASTTCGGVVTAPAGGSTVTLTGGAIPAGNGIIAGTCRVMVNVTAPLAGNFLNTLPAGALQTSNGNNAAPAIATLIVVGTNVIKVSDQKPGSVLVFPFYTSNAQNKFDTRITISNLATDNLFSFTGSIIVHVFFIRGSDCQQSDQYVCLTKGASISFKMSEQDPDTTGYVIALAVDQQGLPVSWNALTGNAFVNAGTTQGNYGAEAFANTAPFGFLTTTANAAAANATLVFNGGVPPGVGGGPGTLPIVPPIIGPLGLVPTTAYGYDQVPNQFAVEIQSPLDAPGQTVVHTGLAGDLTGGGVLTGAAQVGTGLVWRGDEKQGSFVSWLVGGCQRFGVVRADNPRVPGTLGVFLPKGQIGVLRYDTGPSVGLLLTPFQFAAPPATGVIPGTWGGIRTVHKTRVAVTTSLIIPVFMPVC